MARALSLLVVLLLAACSSTGGGGKSTDDPRVKSFMGAVPPELPHQGWMGTSVSSLAQLRGQVVYLQLAFPT